MGYVKNLDREDLWELDETQKTEYLTQLFEKEWNKMTSE